METCLCGCGTEVNSGKKYIFGHARKGKKLSEETKAKMSVARKGKNRSKNLKIVKEQE